MNSVVCTSILPANIVDLKVIPNSNCYLMFLMLQIPLFCRFCQFLVDFNDLSSSSSCYDDDERTTDDKNDQNQCPCLAVQQIVPSASAASHEKYIEGDTTPACRSSYLQIRENRKVKGENIYRIS